MSVDKTPTGVVYTVTSGAAGQQYPLTFPYIKGADVKAYYVQAGTQTSLTYGTHYTVADQTFTASVALPTGAKLAIYRQTDLTQEILWKDGQAVYTPDIMKADDKLTLIAQEISADMSRTVKLTREEEAAGGKPEDVVQSIYASRDAAAASAEAASAQATAAQNNATAAASSADTAAQTVRTAAADAVNAATAQADAAELAAQAAAQSAIEAAASVPDNLVQRVTNAEAKNTQQDTRLDGVESDITALSTTLIASVSDWSNYMAGLAGKLNVDFSNAPANRPYITEYWEATNRATWYRKWSNGLIEQGIAGNGPATVTFPTPFTSSDKKRFYKVGLLCSNTDPYSPTFVVQSDSLTGAVVSARINGPNNGGLWWTLEVSGY